MTIPRKGVKKPYCLATAIYVTCLFVRVTESSFIRERLTNVRTVAKPVYKPMSSFLKPLSTTTPQRITKKWGMSSTDETAEINSSSILGEEQATMEDRENYIDENDETHLSKDSLEDTLEKEQQQQQQQQQRQQQIIDFLVGKLDLKIANSENEYEKRRNEKLLRSYLKILSENDAEEGCCFSTDEVATTIIDQLEECFSYLEKRFNFSHKDNDLGQLVKRFPSVLVRTTCSQKTMESTLDWLQEVFDLNPSQLKKLVQRQPSVLSMDVADDLEPKLQWIQSRLFGMEVTTATKHGGVSKLVQRFPAILTLSVEDQLELKLQWLQTRLQLNNKDLCKLIQRRPAICGYSIQHNLEPKLDWLQMKLVLDDASLSKLVQRKPEVFGYSIDTNLQPKLDWLEARFQMKEEVYGEGEFDHDQTPYSPSLCKFVKRLPAVFGYSIEKKLEPTCRWLEMRMELNERGLQRFILRFPSVLGNNVEENLDPTLSFYESCLGRDVALLLVSKNPTMLSASLQTRLVPRLEQAQKLGMTIDAETMRCMAVDTIERWEASLL